MRTDGQIDRQTDGWTDRQADRWTERRTDMMKPTSAFAVFFKKVSQTKRTMYNGRERRKVHIRNKK